MNNKINLELADNKTFRIWDYVVSHDRMLLRSPKHENQDKNIDILLMGVVYINIPTMLEITYIKIKKIDEGGDFLSKGLDEETTDMYELTFHTNNEKFIIICSSINIEENDLEIMESNIRYDFESH